MTHTDILIYGGGASGTCAAVQAARLGARVTV
ncbi:MAG: FAD-dependent oxidoreductase, partial [Bacteroidota bacterium]